MKRKGSVELILLLLVSLLLFFSSVDIEQNENATANSSSSIKMQEKDYVNQYCTGQIEYRLDDKTRVDCLTDEYVIEFDYAKKWAESVGQSLYYAKKTGKNPAVAIILKKASDIKYINHIQDIDLGIKIFKICANDYTGDDKTICSVLPLPYTSQSYRLNN